MTPHAPKPERTIFLTINSCVNARDLLRGGMLAMLRRSGARVVLLTEGARDDAFVREFAGESVTVEPMRRHAPTWFERRFHTLRYTLFPELGDTVRVLTLPRLPRTWMKRIARTILLAIKRLLGSARTHRTLMWLNGRLFPDRQHGHLFAKYKPDLVAVTEVFNMAADSWVLKRAVRERVPTVHIIRSWDNLTSKGVYPSPVDRLVVWGETMRREALDLHGYTPAQVFVAGAAHLDSLCEQHDLPGRDEFLRGIGGNPAKKLITYAMAPLSRRAHNLEVAVVERLWRLARENAFGCPVQVLVRVYPLRFSEVPPRLVELPGLLIDLPGRTSAVFNDRDLTPMDVRHLTATMRHSDVVVNVASTMSLVAAVTGTPAVCVGFDLDAVPYHESVRRYYEFSHYRHVQECGAVRVAHSMEELVQHITAYLADRSLDRGGRERLLAQMCHQLDGHASERIGRYLVSYLEEVAPRGAALGHAPGATAPASI